MYWNQVEYWSDASHLFTFPYVTVDLFRVEGGQCLPNYDNCWADQDPGIPHDCGDQGPFRAQSQAY
ncbi:hypothetical protein Taro_034275 [Colocasia esculenta]|uniref:Uncharacterized protein n=1 Tax=Colocasia esculenta TaxID=4460 RepID=A0A843W9I2_COLES|nr:hypothetical protein [Colocasia esculenta]